MNKYIWVGLDVHLDSITAAILEDEAQDPEVVKLSGDLMKVRRLFRRLAKRGPVRACYEASGAGYVLQRTLDHDGFHCDVIAPSLIPTLPGDRSTRTSRETLRGERLSPNPIDLSSATRTTSLPV